jgi:hypothetical protein
MALTNVAFIKWVVGGFISVTEDERNILIKLKNPFLTAAGHEMLAMNAQ